jgi:hypothetical protein
MVFVYVMRSSSERLHPYVMPLLISFHSVCLFSISTNNMFLLYIMYNFYYMLENIIISYNFKEFSSGNSVKGLFKIYK